MRPKRDWGRYTEAVRNRDLVLPFNPPAIFVETVRGCPHACAMCHFGGSPVQKMDTGLLALLEPFFPDLEVLAVHGQGEPLLGDLEYCVEHSVHHDFVLHMNTSGFLLTKRLADLLARTRLSIRFSIHAGTGKTYRRIMGQDLDRVRNNVTYLVDKTRQTGHAADFWFSFLILKENVEEIEDFVRLAHACGVTSIRFMRPLPNFRTLRGVRFPDRDFYFSYFEQFNADVFNRFQQKLPRCRALCAELGITIEAGTLTASCSNHHPVLESVNNMLDRVVGHKLFPLRQRPGFCIAPWLGQLVIDVQGNVRLCCSTTTQLGNLHAASLAEIWNSPAMQAIRSDFARGITPRACSYCQGFSSTNYPSNAFAGLKR